MRLLGRMSVTAEGGETIGVEVLQQRDGGIYVRQRIGRIDGGITIGETCFYCAGKKIGCVSCKSPVGDCTKGTVWGEA